MPDFWHRLFISIGVSIGTAAVPLAAHGGFDLPDLPLLPEREENADSTRGPEPRSEARPPDRSEPVEIRPVTATGQRPVTVANSQSIRDRDLSLRPVAEPGDLLKVTPGLFVGRHAGGGKANQYFLRGFDIDHGTDLALWVDDMPVNNVSHAHGQGYADLHFVIPELVDRVTVTKGPTDIRQGDFATAGAVELSTRTRLEENRLTVSAGMLGARRVLAMLAPDASSGTFLAAEISRFDGPFEHPEDMDRYNLFFRAPLFDGPRASLRLTLMAYGSGWNASGQIPLRAVRNGWVDRYGSLDPEEGGGAQRHSVSLAYRSARGDDGVTASAYLIRSRLSLFSNFTFFAEDSVNGDMINQRDDRVTAGFRAEYARNHALGPVPARARFGIATRSDVVQARLDRARGRVVSGRVVDADVREGSLGAWAMESITPFPWLYAEAGARVDHFAFAVDDRMNDTGAASLTGIRDAAIASPKVNVVVTPFRRTDLYFNYGEGFHSNDARGVTSRVDPARPLTKARGGELGARTNLRDRWDLAASVWRLDLEGEFVWVGDGGFTEENGATRRFGVDVETRVRVLDWLWADFDATWCRAAYVRNAGNGTAVALAPRRTFAGGLAARHPSGFHGSARVQNVDDRPADEAGDLRARGFTVVDLAAGYRRGPWEIAASVYNALNTTWYTAQFASESRVRRPDGTLEPAAVADMHVVPGPPLHARVAVTRYF